MARDGNKLRALDLFSCIGCHAVGFERAGIETAAFCEINPWRRDVIATNFPGRPIYDDIRNWNTSHADLHAEIVIGGPPCQRTSVAAAIHGYRDGESLWPHMLYAASVMAAEWIVVEQPPGNEAWETKVSDDLSNAGRYSARIEFGASDVGAPYLRRRVFILACASLSRLEVAWSAVPSEIESVKRAANARGDWNADKLGTLRVDARSAGEMDRGRASRQRRERIQALGDSNPPHMAEVIGRAIMRAAA